RFFSPSPPQKGGEGRGEEALFINSPSLRLSPSSFLARRERQNAAGVLRAEHNWLKTCDTADCKSALRARGEQAKHIPHRMGEGESSSVGRRIQPLWKLRAAGLAVSSPVGRERVRVRVILFEIRLLSGACFCTNPKSAKGSKLHTKSSSRQNRRRSSD